jgi:hypothetical protein
VNEGRLPLENLPTIYAMNTTVFPLADALNALARLYPTDAATLNEAAAKLREQSDQLRGIRDRRDEWLSAWRARAASYRADQDRSKAEGRQKAEDYQRGLGDATERCEQEARQCLFGLKS